MFKDINSKIQFCSDFISLVLNDKFDEPKSSNIEEVFDLCVRYLDKDEHDKECIWECIESKMIK